MKKKNDLLYLPSLRGKFGEWIYYSTLVSFSELASRVDFADEIHSNKGLSDMIQRNLKKGRAEEISKYLREEKERFFNSLVVAVYGGAPNWYSLGITGEAPQEVSRDAAQKIGFLSFDGNEKMFAIDGQHRLSGIKDLVKSEGSVDEVSVIFVAHQNDAEGVVRSRRLFTTLNKTAVPVSKGEIIALDENDMMAVVARRLVEQHQFFMGARIAYSPQDNIPVSDKRCLTTIGNLYEILLVLFSKIIEPNRKKSELKFCRSIDEETIETYYEAAVNFFDQLADKFNPLGEYFWAKDFEKIVEKYRTPTGGCLLFRPVGLRLVVELIAELIKDNDLSVSIGLASDIPLNLDQEPFRQVIWDENRDKMIPGGRALARSLLLYMLAELPENKVADLGRRYGKVLGADGSVFPEKIYD